MTNSGKLFADEPTNWLIYKAGFNQSKYKMSVYYKYVPYGSKLAVLSYENHCVYWYTYQEIGKWFVAKLGKWFHVKFPGYTNWFMSIGTSQLEDYSISFDKTRYATLLEYVLRLIDIRRTDNVRQYS